LKKLQVLFLAIGVSALAWLVYRIGFDRLLEGLAAIGFGFVLTCSAHLGALMLDSATLRACAGPPGLKIPFVHFARTSISGHGINESTPFGKLGEITKYTLLRERLKPARAAGALVAQNICMFVVNCGLIALSAPIAILIFDADGPAAIAFMIASGVFLVAGAIGLLILSRGLGRWPFLLVRRAGLGRFRPSKARVDKWRSGWRKVEEAWQAAAKVPRGMETAWLSAIASRMCNVVETALILFFLGGENILAAAVLSLASSQLVGWVFSFVPLSAGTAEGGAYIVFRAAGLSPELGVMVEIGRKLRKVVFISLGILVLGWGTFRKQRQGAQVDDD
jgi:hypothetical protein